MLYGLGCRFFDELGTELYPCGSSLEYISGCDTTALVEYEDIHFIAACDVTNPLCGKNGAAYVFALQKGASAEQLESLDKGLEHFAQIAGIDKSLPGSGAAGGCGGALISLLNADFISGAGLLVKSKPFQNALQECDIVITGEGKTDNQTADGKLVSVIASQAKKLGKQVIVISGAVEGDLSALYDLGVTECCAATP